MIVNGTLNVQGNSSNMVTFTKITDYNWVGIRFNGGSSGEINWAKIENSVWGIFFNNLGNNSIHVSNSYIQNNSSYGIWCENSSLMLFQNNHILNNGSYGIYCNNYSSPYINYNMIKDQHNIAGIYTSYYAAPRASTSGGTGSNVIKDNNGCGLYSNYYSVPHFGDGTSYAYNSIYNNNSYEVKAENGANVWVQYNYWGSGATFSGSTIHNEYPLSTDPNSGRTRMVENPNNSIAFQNANLNIMSSNSVNVSASIEGNDDSELNSYLDKFRKEGNTPEGRLALINIEDYYRNKSRAGFENFVNNEIFSRKDVKDDLTVMGLELINHSLMDKGDYKRVIRNLEKIKGELLLNDNIEKNTLYALGSVCLNCLNDKSSAVKYFDELKQKYPKDIFAYNSELLLGNNPGLNLLKQDSRENTIEKTDLQNQLLVDNYPNPFNPATTISYTLPEAGKVQIKVFDILGREVATLINGFDSKGKHSVTWDGSNTSSGIYFYTITFKNQTISKKMLLMK